MIAVELWGALINSLPFGGSNYIFTLTSQLSYLKKELVS